MAELIGSREAAERLHVSQRHIARLVHEGRLVPAVKLPGKTGFMMFDPADVDRYGRERKRPGRPSQEDATGA